MSTVEHTLMTHPAVAAAATLELPDTDGDKVRSIIIAINSDHHLGLKEIQNWARDRCADKDLPDRWLFINEMPLRADGTPNVEILRVLLAGRPS
jgi:acyl-coenzyme A synthetase/AMP-(fatty) acid ligase